jgi:hypothetical protein
MAYFYLDDSKHHARGFSLAAFAICDTDPQIGLSSLLLKNGFDPSVHEFKSSTSMKDNSNLQSLRDDFRQFIRSECKLAVCIVEGDANIGPAALRLLQKTLTHKSLKERRHEVFFDEGLFSSRQAAEIMSKECDGLEKCSFHFEQDSKIVAGIQIADLVAHTCATMLSDALGHVHKNVRIENSGYPYDVEINLGFELWAGLRYCFLSENKTDSWDEDDFAFVVVEPYGLFIHDSVSDPVAKAARKRFGEMYLGCIH